MLFSFKAATFVFKKRHQQWRRHGEHLGRGIVPPNPKSRQKLSRKSAIRFVGYTFRLKMKNYVEPPPPPPAAPHLLPISRAGTVTWHHSGDLCSMEIILFSRANAFQHSPLEGKLYLHGISPLADLSKNN